MDNTEKKTRKKRVEILGAIEIVRKLFLDKKGTMEKPITNTQIARHLLSLGIKTYPYDIRNWIHEIRTKTLFEHEGQKGFICANHKGYWLSYNHIEHLDYKERLIKRQRKEEEVISAMGL